MNRLRIEPTDAIAFVALVLLTVGAGLAWLPAGFLVPGALLLVYSIAASRQEPAP